METYFYDHTINQFSMLAGSPDTDTQTISCSPCYTDYAAKTTPIRLSETVNANPEHVTPILRRKKL
jgi:hypothetical protein